MQTERPLGSADDTFKPIGDRRRSKEGAAKQSEAVQSKKGPSQAYRGLFWTERLRPFKPKDGLSCLLRALTNYQGSLSGRRRVLLG